MPAFVNPPVWTDEQLEADREQSIALFIKDREATLGARYQELLDANLTSVTDLFVATDDLRNLITGQTLATHPAFISIARYMAGPPVSEDIFDVLAGTSIAKRKRLSTDLARQAAALLETVLDRRRFPWLFETPARLPTEVERAVAISWTAGLKTSQEVATEQRTGSSTRQEDAVYNLLKRTGFTPREGKSIGFIDDMERGSYRVRETGVAGTKCDVPVRLGDGRLLLIECKVSNTGTNSVKRLNRECGGKAAKWRATFGQSAVCAVVAGVFRLTNLRDAQSSDGLTLVWEHNLTPLRLFLEQATPS